MISIRMNDGTYQNVNPTIFPDGTSQVWKLDLNLTEAEGPKGKIGYKSTSIKWSYELENELIWLCQLIQLLHHSNTVIENIKIPYLPYARQDKKITNESTFAKHTMIKMIRSFYKGPIYSFDVHSKDDEIRNISPTIAISNAIVDFSPNYIVFPDIGAYNRYNKELNLYLKEKNINVIVLEKNRDQLTGTILGLQIDKNNTSLPNAKIEDDSKFLIVDDICDGGATFKSAANTIKTELNDKCEIGLYVSHGIYSKGLNPLIESGITKFYTTDSLVHNLDNGRIDKIFIL